MTFRPFWLTLAFSTGLVTSVAADPLTAGRQVAEAFHQGDAERILADATPELRAALGSSEALTTLRDQLREGWGTEDLVLSERVETQAGYEVFTRVSRWTGAEMPVEMVVSFDQAGKIAGFFIRPQPVAAPSDHLDYRTKASLRLPVDGTWHVVWGGREIARNYHAIDRGQRFAIDLVMTRNGSSHAGDPADLASYHCWGRPVLSPAAGVVVSAVDGLLDQRIGDSDPQNPAGNHVVLDLGQGEYAFLAHFQRGSLRVAPGESVAAGEVLGQCGNSGNSSEPHIHMHLQDSPLLGQGAGLPAQFLNYRADGAVIARGEPQQGEMIEAMD